MMPDFSRRSYQPELLDEDNIPRDLLFQNLRELDAVNRMLGGHSISIAGLKRLLKDKKHTYHIADIGCGGGDAMKQMAIYAAKAGYSVRITGVDINQDCVDFSREFCSGHPTITAVRADYRDFLNSGEDVDIIHCSLFCHHLTDEQLTGLLRNLNTHARCGFIINDLHRNMIAYHSIRFLTRVLNGSSLVKNDAPLSVLRSFRRKDLVTLLDSAGVKNYDISWKWAYRFLVVSEHAARL